MISRQLMTLWPSLKRSWMTSADLQTLAAPRSQTSQISPAHSLERARAVGPVLFVLDENETSLDVLLSDLTQRFGNAFTVRGDTSPTAALSALQEMEVATSR